jgi:hypothetical protein
MSRLHAFSALALTLLAAPSALAQTVPPVQGQGGVVVILPPQPASPVMPYPPQAPAPAPPPQVAYPYPPPPQYLEMPPPPERESTFSVKLAAGPSYQRIFDSSIVGAEANIYFGTSRGWYGGFEMGYGRMTQGLLTWTFRPAFSWEGRLGIVHLGLGGNLTIISVSRATSDPAMTSFGGGVSGFGSVDLVSDGHHTLYLALKMRAELLAGSDSGGATPWMWGPSALIGWRYH